MGVEIRTTPSGDLLPSTPKPLFDADLRGDAGEYYDISPDGQQFLLTTPATVELATPVTVVLNWTEELVRQAPKK